MTWICFGLTDKTMSVDARLHSWTILSNALSDPLMQAKCVAKDVRAKKLGEACLHAMKTSDNEAVLEKACCVMSNAL